MYFSPDFNYVISFLFCLQVVSHDCDIIQEAIRRYYHLIFINANSNQDFATVDGTNNRYYDSNKEFAGFLDHLSIHLMGPCEQFPSEFMDERCKI